MRHVDSIYRAKILEKPLRKFLVFWLSSNLCNIPQNLCGLVVGKIAMETRAKNYPLRCILIEIIIPKQYLMRLLRSERDFPFRGCSHITGVSVISFVAFIYKKNGENKTQFIRNIIRLP